MPTLLRVLVLLIIFYSPFEAVATKHCFRQSGLPVFLRIQSELNQSEDLQLKAVQASCKEIKFPESHYQVPQSLSAKIATPLNDFIGALILGGASGVLSFMNSSEHERKFKQELEQIKKIQDRYERIKRVYELVHRTMGPYDQEISLRDEFVDSWLQPMKPSTILARAKAKGTGGVCRHHTALLSWSLLQVARPVGENSMGLTENSFSATTKYGCSKEECHTWIQLNIPSQTENGLRFENVDLDTTWYEAPSILHSRNNGISPQEQNRLLGICEAVIQCLSEMPQKKRGSSSTNRQDLSPAMPGAR